MFFKGKLYNTYMARRRRKAVTISVDAEAYNCVRDGLRALPGDDTVSSAVSGYLVAICPMVTGLLEAVESGSPEAVKAAMEGITLDMFGRLGTEVQAIRRFWAEEARKEDAP